MRDRRTSLLLGAALLHTMSAAIAPPSAEAQPAAAVATEVEGWPANGGNLANHNYSPLSEIDSGNVAGLKGVWHTRLRGSGVGTKYSGSAQPVVGDGRLFISTGANDVFAVDLDTGEILWQYEAHLEEISTVCCGWVSRGVALGEGKVFVDVGANIGSYSVFAARCGADVLAIEANPQTAVKLGFNVRANDLDNVRVINSAVGPREDTLPLWQEPSNCGFATFVKDLTTGEWAGDWSPTFVKVRPLTGIAHDQGLNRIDVLKVDVEGFEDRVLLPFLRHAERSLWPRVILLETNCRPYWTEDCLPELATRDYRITGRTNDNMIFELAA